MGTLDEKKAEISLLEKLLFVSFAILITLIGWIATNFETASTALLITALAAVSVIGIFAAYTYNQIRKLIRELRDL